MKGLYNLKYKVDFVGVENCFISEITVAELMFGVENSEQKQKNKRALDNFIEGINILPIFNAITIYAKEKSRLKKSGVTIDDFDLLIASTSVTHNLTMVTNNIKHFNKIKDIIVEDCTKYE